MKTKHLIPTTIGLTLAMACCSTVSASPLLGTTADTVAVLAGAGVTSSGASTITGNVGSSPTNTIIGFPPAVIAGGGLTSTVVAFQAQGDALAAYNFLAIQTPTLDLTARGMALMRFLQSGQLPLYLLYVLVTLLGLMVWMVV